MHLFPLLSIILPIAAVKHCTLPQAGEDFQTALPEEVELSSAAVSAAIQYANEHNRASIQIFRNNCLVQRGAFDVVTDNIPTQVFSVTKSVVGILAGLAVQDGKLNLKSPIGRYLPAGWGDAAHRSITVQDILTETSGTQEAILAEAGSVGLDPSAIQEFLNQKLIHKPGTYFEYSQRNADAVAYIVQSAIGQDLQEYAQARLFQPLGIAKSDWFWLRDRSGYTYGYAWLFIAPKHLARLGLLMQNNGNYRGQQIVPKSWVKSVAQPSKENPCYGYLFWNNKGKPCTGANIPVATTVNATSVPSAPLDMFAMVGALQQNNFMVPSLNMTVTWTGYLGDEGPNLSVILSATPGDLYYNFFRILMKGVLDKHISDPGPYTGPPVSLDINPLNYLNPVVLANDLVTNPKCNVLFCNGGIPTQGFLDNLQALLGYRPSF